MSLTTSISTPSFEHVQRAAHAIKLVIFDVDGVLTNGQLIYGSDGTEYKAFHVQDGSAIKLLQAHGVTVALITGRQSVMVDRRAKELGINHVYQGNEAKTQAYTSLLEQLSLTDAAVACIGDDLADLPLIRRCGLGISVPNGHPVVQQAAAYVTTIEGGQGVAREVAELLLRAQDAWPFDNL